jgi:hypothetical protein
MCGIERADTLARSGIADVDSSDLAAEAVYRGVAL